MLMILLLAIAGIALILADFVFIPGMIVGAVGGGLILYSTYLNYQSYGPWPAFFEIAIVLAVLPKLVLASMHRASLKNEMTQELGFVGLPDLKRFVGRKGVALSDLRPSGSVSVVDQGDTVQLDCITDGEYIGRGSEIEIIESRGPSLIVRSLPKSALAE